jgi:PAS domain-containing protein
MQATAKCAHSGFLSGKPPAWGWRWLEGVFTNLLDGRGIQAIVTNFRDFTEQRESQAALRESEERYRTVSEVTSDYAHKDRLPYFNPLPLNVCGSRAVVFY